VPGVAQPKSLPRRDVSRLTLLAVLALGPGIAVLPGRAGAQQRLPRLPAELEELRASLSKYEDLEVAAEDLYISPLGCIEYGPAGEPGSGIYQSDGIAMLMMNGALFVDGKLDPDKPEVLIYEQVRLGHFRLAGAIWMLPVEGPTDRPQLFGQTFEGPVSVVGRSRLMPAHFVDYDLYAWLWKENPNGLFAPINPDLPCPKDGYSLVGNIL